MEIRQLLAQPVPMLGLRAPSGTGKSSLLASGLVPRGGRGRAPGSSRPWTSCAPGRGSSSLRLSRFSPRVIFWHKSVDDARRGGKGWGAREHYQALRLVDAAGLAGFPYTRYHEIAATMSPDEVHPEVGKPLARSLLQLWSSRFYFP